MPGMTQQEATIRLSEREEWQSAFLRVGAVAADFALWRLGFAALVLCFILFLTFFGLDMARGGALGPSAAQGVVKTLVYLSQLAHGNLGLATSVRVRLTVPVAEVILNTLFKSLGLLAASSLCATLVGTVLGSLAARRRHSWPSMGYLLASLVGVSVPSFFTALLLQLGVVWGVRHFQWQLVPVAGFGWDAHIVLPALVLAARPIAQIFRVANVSLAGVLDEDYVRTACFKGLPPFTLMCRHVYRNVAIPVLTTVALSLRFSLPSPSWNWNASWKPGGGSRGLTTSRR